VTSSETWTLASVAMSSWKCRVIAVRGADNPSGNDGPTDEIRRSEAVAQTQLPTAGGGNGSRTAFGLSLPRCRVCVTLRHVGDA
jgi:hypothetical protein